jgi:hypothetical protein
MNAVHISLYVYQLLVMLHFHDPHLFSSVQITRQFNDYCNYYMNLQLHTRYEGNIQTSLSEPYSQIIKSILWISVILTQVIM